MHIQQPISTHFSITPTASSSSCPVTIRERIKAFFLEQNFTLYFLFIAQTDPFLHHLPMKKVEQQPKFQPSPKVQENWLPLPHATSPPTEEGEDRDALN
jgi:hypothetical protein